MSTLTHHFEDFASFVETAKYRQSWYGKNTFGGNQAVLPWRASVYFRQEGCLSDWSR